jgi:hypothetical protein
VIVANRYGLAAEMRLDGRYYETIRVPYGTRATVVKWRGPNTIISFTDWGGRVVVGTVNDSDLVHADEYSPSTSTGGTCWC